MTPDSTAFARLIERFRASDPAAIAAVYASYGGVVREAVRRRLPNRLRNIYDSLDFTQEVWLAFCRDATDRQCPFQSDELQAYLIQMTYHKVVDVCRRRLRSQSHTVLREEHVGRVEGEKEIPFAGREPSPSQCAIAGEQWAAIAAALPPQHLRVIERLNEGYSQAEVAEMAGICTRSVRRIVDRVRELCEESR